MNERTLPVLFRAVGDTIGSDITGLPVAVDLPRATWPVIDALAQSGVTRWTDPGMSRLPMITPASAAPQALEKGSVTPITIRVTLEPAETVTLANVTDVSVQARQVAGGTTKFVAIMSAATAMAADKAVIDALTTAAGAAKASAAEAIQTVAVFGGTVLLIVSDPIGMTDYLAAADSSNGQLRLVYDANATVNLAVAALGVSLDVVGLNDLAAPRPSLFGTDLATMVTLVGPLCSPGSVATWPVTP